MCFSMEMQKMTESAEALDQAFITMAGREGKYLTF